MLVYAHGRLDDNHLHLAILHWVYLVDTGQGPSCGVKGFIPCTYDILDAEILGQNDESLGMAYI